MVHKNQEMVIASVRDSVEMYAKQAGEILLSFYKQTTLARNYKSDGSFATQADIASERYLLEKLKPLIPGAGFYAEESGIVVGNDYEWVIDPLDGTNNFAHGIPYFCVSIALTYKQEPVLAVIYQPILKELFSAQLGKGAFLNGHKLAVSGQESMPQAIMSMCSSSEGTEVIRKIRSSLVSYDSSMRSFGASALDIAYLAAGKLDGCFYKGTCWWDIAAGSLLVTEAGGKVSTLAGDQVGPKDPSFVGGNEPIFKELSQLIKSALSV